MSQGQGHSRYVVADGLRTHYLEAGDGPALVLLHGGEYGAAAELTWADCIPAFAQRFRVLAIDLVGFGRSDKIRDFAGGQRRLMLRQIGAVLRTLGVEQATFVGASLSARMLLDVANRQPLRLPIERLVAVGIGLAAPLAAAREVLESYDGTLDGLRPSQQVLFGDPAWRDSEEFLQRRFEISSLPGAWEISAAAGLRSPTRSGADARSHVRPPARDYGGIAVPTMLVRGQHDRLVPTDTWQALAQQIPGSTAVEIPGSGHYPQIERAAHFTEAVLEFLAATASPGSTDA